MQRAMRAAAVLVALVLLFPGCTRIKRWAYERGDRDAWQQPERVLATLAPAPGSVVADVGSGGGYFTFRFAEAVGEAGRVYAVDVDEGMIEYVSEEAPRRGLTWVETILATPEDARLPEGGVDLIFTSNTYHHIGERVAYFARLRAALRPAGRLAIVEYKPEGFFQRNHGTGAEQIREEMRAAGYALEQEHDFLERQHFLVFGAAE